MICQHLNAFSDGDGHEKMGMGMEIYFAGTDEDGDIVERGRLGTDLNFMGTDGDKCSSPCRALVGNKC